MTESKENQRGVIYVYWGDRVEKELKRSIDSLKEAHPELPIKKVKIPPDSSLLDKAAMLDYSPFDSTLFLDTDTVVLDRLDYGFEKAEQFGLACCINECPWARRYADIAGDQIEYNTGVLFFTAQAKPIFTRWKEISSSIDSSIVFNAQEGTSIMQLNDQAGFSQAIEDTNFNPFILPLNWNLRPKWQKTYFGPIKIWHDPEDPPNIMGFWNEDQIPESTIIQYREVLSES